MRTKGAVGLAATLLRVYGLAGIARRVRHEVEVRSHLIQRRSSASPGLPEDPGGSLRLAFMDLDALGEAYAALPDADHVRHRIVTDADRVLAGELRFYGGRWIDTGWPAAWRRNPETGYEHPREVHWSAISDHDVAAGDIKDVWEASRFGWVYTLLRALVVTGEDRYAEAFWEALADWIIENPPNCGPNWSCGQEASIRAVAVLFALRTLGAHPSATAERVALARRLLRATGDRVAATIGYAASQRNNHMISEAACLFTLGVVFPSWSPARRWRRQGWRHLQAAVADQFYPDGTYAQHSVTYQRLAVQTLCWALVVARESGAQLPATAIAAVQRSVSLLHALQDPTSGYLPNLGSNDGVLLLPLSTCDYRDFRPALQTASVLVGQGRRYEPGSWDEEGLWLLGQGFLGADDEPPPQPARVVAPDGGLLVTRGPRSLAMLRIAPAWRHRPAQADDCHVDVWLDGVEVAGDPGTYRYTALPPWDNGLAVSRVHNTVTIDGGDRYRRLGRFLSTDWPRTRVLLDASGGDWQCWVVESEVPVWKRVGGHHRRLLLRRGDDVLVGDQVRADQPSTVQVTWNLPALGRARCDGATFRLDSEYLTVLVTGPSGGSVRETIAGEGPEGWHAPTYGLRQERRTVRLTCPTGGAATVAGLFTRAPDAVDVEALRTRLRGALTEPSSTTVAELLPLLHSAASKSDADAPVAQVTDMLHRL